MAYQVTRTREESRAQFTLLLTAFEQAYPNIKNNEYKEAQLRIDFINPLLKTFGWDVDNEHQQPQFLREVIQEETIAVEQATGSANKNPDYTLRMQGTRKIFVEAKRIALDIEHSAVAAFQTRRYGWSAGLGIAVLTNFEGLIIYDCRHKPESTDAAYKARYCNYVFQDYLANFDTLYNLLSYEAVSAGALEQEFSLNDNELSTFDQYFLIQIETWRKRLSTAIIHSNPALTENTINLLVQRLINRIVFLRICEDRTLEAPERLKNIQSYDELKTLFIEADEKYNSGLFDFIEDNFSLQLQLQPQVLIDIFKELYYPESPYDFSVVDPAILSQIYERYLGSKIQLDAAGQAVVIEEPEVAASSGVVPTPKEIVDNIVKETLLPVLQGKTSAQLLELKIADICCGSGTFLLAVYDELVAHLTLALTQEGCTDTQLIYYDTNGDGHLTLKAKQNVLVKCIYGVDINPYAVEVTMFSLYIKLLENEKAGSLQQTLQAHRLKALPNLKDNIKNGNSLVDDNFFNFMPGAINNNDLLFELRPFDWQTEFSFLTRTGGFDAIVGNPPYVRIQNMVKYQPEETGYYQSPLSRYQVVPKEAFDKYYLFIERAIGLLNDTGVLGYIVPHKFFIVRGGAALRNFISTQAAVQKIIHFGVTQVFPKRSTYTAVIIIDKVKREEVGFARIRNITRDFVAGQINYTYYPSERFGQLPWLFVSAETNALFQHMEDAGTVPLIALAQIPVGLQTSGDDVYIFKVSAETDTTYLFEKDGVSYEVEKDICLPCIYDLSFDMAETIKANAQIIFPYKRINNKAHLIDEITMELEYPQAWEYLNRFKDQLSQRSFSNKSPKWYQFGRTQSLAKFHNQPKLIWSVLSITPKYIYDEQDLQFTGGGNGPYYGLIAKSAYSPLYLLGLLAHPVLEAMIKVRASQFQGGYYSHGRQFLANLPIRALDLDNPAERAQYESIVRVVNHLINAHLEIKESSPLDAVILQRKYDYLKGVLYERVNEIYNIDDSAIDTIISDGLFITE